MSFLSAIPRRRMLRVGGIGLTGLTLPRALKADERRERAARTVKARSCLLIYLDGGPSHIDLFDRKPNAPEEVRGPFASIATSVPGTSLCEHLPRLASQM